MDVLDVQIQFHTNMVNIHKQQIHQLTQLKTMSELKKLSHASDAEEPALENETTSDNGTAETTDSGWNNDAVAEMDSDQDLIWERIRQARLKNTHPEVAQPTPIPSENLDKKNTTAKKNNLNVVVDTVNPMTKASMTKASMTKASMTKASMTKPMTKTTPEGDMPTLITKLSKFPANKQNSILRNMFMRAKTNMEKLAKLDADIANNLDDKIQEEANRLLEVYLRSN
jgi:hypothetical protein